MLVGSAPHGSEPTRMCQEARTRTGAGAPRPLDVLPATSAAHSGSH
jgi:hypothetical protein